MKKAIERRMPVAAGLFLWLVASAAGAEERLFSTRPVERSLTATKPCRLVVDNVWGDVRIIGQAGTTVEVDAVETVWAESAAAAERAALEVSLVIGERDGAIDVFVDGPFRHPQDRGRWADRHRHSGYTVAYDIEVRIPRRCDVDARTVNDGEIRVTDVAGALAVRNVNGDIRLERVAATGGEVSTVNGPILGTFGRGPTDRLSFRSVNGRIEVTFPPRLAADLRVESAWGEMWSEFELTPLAAPPPERRRDDGRLVIEAGRAGALRVGGGGPEISFETLNGDILIRKES